MGTISFRGIRSRRNKPLYCLLARENTFEEIIEVHQAFELAGYSMGSNTTVRIREGDRGYNYILSSYATFLARIADPSSEYTDLNPIPKKASWFLEQLKKHGKNHEEFDTEQFYDNSEESSKDTFLDKQLESIKL